MPVIATIRNTAAAAGTMRGNDIHAGQRRGAIGCDAERLLDPPAERERNLRAVKVGADRGAEACLHVHATRTAGAGDQVPLDRFPIDAVELAVDVGLNGGRRLGAVHSPSPSRPARFWRRNASRSSVCAPDLSLAPATGEPSRLAALLAAPEMMPCSTA